MIDNEPKDLMKMLLDQSEQWNYFKNTYILKSYSPEIIDDMEKAFRHGYDAGLTHDKRSKVV